MMEGCLNTEKDVDKLLSKFTSYKKQNFSNLDQLHEQLSKLKEDFIQFDTDTTLSKSQQSLLNQQNKKLKLFCQKLSSQHKDLHSSVSKIGKTIDRNFDAECNSVSLPEILEDENQQNLLNTAICEHFYRKGSLTVAESLAKECSLQVDDRWHKPFVEMNEILQSLKHKQVDLALEWAGKSMEQLSSNQSNLVFKLHRLKFLQILKQGSSHQHEALQYAKNFQQFCPEYSLDVQQLMGCFLYLKQDVSQSPYAHLFSEQIWDDVYECFSKEACRTMGMSIESPLMTIFSAGCQALPALVAIKSVIEQRQCPGLLPNNDELPIELDLEDSQQYHSVFACPILRQQTTSKNPPLRLVCGHVISTDALHKLVLNSKVKCPYCPVEQSPSETKEIFY